MVQALLVRKLSITTIFYLRPLTSSAAILQHLAISSVVQYLTLGFCSQRTGHYWVLYSIAFDIASLTNEFIL